MSGAAERTDRFGKSSARAVLGTGGRRESWRRGFSGAVALPIRGTVAVVDLSAECAPQLDVDETSLVGLIARRARHRLVGSPARFLDRRLRQAPAVERLPHLSRATSNTNEPVRCGEKKKTYCSTVALPVATFAHIASAEYRMRAAALGSGVVMDAGMVLLVGADEPVPPWPARIVAALDHSLPWVLLAWLAGVFVFVGRLNFGLMVARRLKTADTEAPPLALQQLFEELRIRLASNARSGWCIPRGCRCRR